MEINVVTARQFCTPALLPHYGTLSPTTSGPYLLTRAFGSLAEAQAAFPQSTAACDLTGKRLQISLTVFGELAGFYVSGKVVTGHLIYYQKHANTSPIFSANSRSLTEPRLFPELDKQVWDEDTERRTSIIDLFSKTEEQKGYLYRTLYPGLCTFLQRLSF